MQKICDFLLLLMGIAVIVLGILLAGVRLVGLTPYAVMSGSMEPVLHVGAVAYAEKVDPGELETGDLLTFRSGEIVVTHRIVEVLEDPSGKRSFLTRGDANLENDGTPVEEEEILGRVKFSIPWLGYIPVTLQNFMVLL